MKFRVEDKAPEHYKSHLERIIYIYIYINISIYVDLRRCFTVEDLIENKGDRGGTVFKAPCHKLESCWFDRSWCQWIFR